ncbi:MAG TPA: S9 family peptidase [Blastocatellia bacterium]|nr:S9 family peptidase [Blastocatellia bacterium]
MKKLALRRVAAFTISLIIFATLSPLVLAQAKRAMTVDDVMAMRVVSDPRLSPDGRTVAFVVTVADLQTNTRNSEVWLVSVEGGEPRRLTASPKRDDAPQWAADSRRLAFISDRDGKPQVYVIAVDGGEAQKVTDVKTAVQSFAWSPDGRRIAYIAAEPISEEREKEKKAGFDQVVIDADYQYARINVIDVPFDGAAKPLWTSQPDLHVTDLAWHHSGEYIAFAARKTPRLADSATTEVYINYISQSVFNKTLTMTQNNRAEASVTWINDGDTLTFLSTSDKYPTIGPARIHSVTIGGLQKYRGGIMLGAMAPDEDPKVRLPQFDGYITSFEPEHYGRYIYFAADVGVSRHLYRMPVDGSRLEQLTTDEGRQGPFSLPDKGDRIAFIKEDATHPADVWIASISTDAHGAATLTGARQLTRMNLQAESFALGRTEVIRWKSAKDSREIEGLLVYPLDYDAAKRYPLITSIHGGPEGAYQSSYMAGYGEFPHVYAARGYLSFFPNFRGSSNYGAAFAAANVGDLGGGDYQDILSGVDYIIQRGLADAERLAIKGYSYGGYMSGWIIGHTTRFKAAVFGAGLANAISYYSTADIQSQRETLHQGTPWRNNQNMIERSPVFYLQNARTPSLIYHGEKDERVPLGQSMETYMGLRQAGVPVEMIVYPREGHGLREPTHQLDKMRRELAWIEKYVRGE